MVSSLVMLAVSAVVTSVIFAARGLRRLAGRVLDIEARLAGTAPKAAGPDADLARRVQGLEARVTGLECEPCDDRSDAELASDLLRLAADALTSPCVAGMPCLPVRRTDEAPAIPVSE